MSVALRLVHPAEDKDAGRWRAVEKRDARADGAFWTCVKTTGVYCLPSCAGRPHRKNVMFVDTRAEAEAEGYRPCKRCRPDRFLQGAIGERIAGIEWERAGAALDACGWSKLGRLLSDDECTSLIAGYEEDACYRSTVVMRRHGFGEGEYRYYSDPAPAIVSELRTQLYARLAPVANEWAKAFGAKAPYPARHDAYRKFCAKAGQTRPTPLILKYGLGDYNRLHQDLYGEEVFPIQVAILLSAPGREFEGGEFVLTEQSPRRQSRAMVVPLEKGDAVAFAVSDRPVAGERGIYRAKMRHGVSEVRDGARYCLGVIFHDAA